MNVQTYRSISIGFAVVLLSCDAAGAQQQPEVTELQEKAIELESGEVLHYEHGTLRVPENRSDPKSRTIGVGFARFRCSAEKRACPPIFVLPGGPGGSLIARIEVGDPRRRERALRSYARFRHLTDVVLVDQRGYSSRGDVFEVEVPQLERAHGRPTTIEDQVAHAERFARSTVDVYAESEVDLRGYTILECARDVNDLCLALGYDQVILEGTSFGSQWSLMVMRLFPELVARALLSGVEPVDHGFDMPRYVYAALQRMWAAIDSDPAFESYLPEGGMNAAARTVIERLERGPVVVTGSQGSEPVAWLGPTDFPWSQPSKILAMYHGHYNSWRRTAERGGGQGRTVDLIGYLIDSSSGTTPERRLQLWDDPAVRFLSRRNFAPLLATASIWPTDDIGNALRRPVLCEIPILFAQGDWDVKTPLENTLEIAPYFPSGHVLVAERGGHGVLGAIQNQHPEVWSQVEEFIQTGDLQGVPARVRLSPSRRFDPPTFSLER